MSRAIRLGTNRDVKQLLPGENIAVFMNNNKLTRDPGKDVRYAVVKEQAQDHLTAKEGWANEQFDEVDWYHLHIKQDNNPDRYKIWLSKNHSRHCGTQLQVGHYSRNINGEISYCVFGVKK